MAALVAAERPKEILEIGTYMGHTTRLLAENCPKARIHTVDLPLDYSPEKDNAGAIPKDDFHLIQRRVVGREFMGSEYSSRITQHFQDTAKWDFTGIGKPGFFYIDGSHTYEHCLSDSENCFRISGGSGVFLWHDLDDYHPGVVKFALEWRAQGKNMFRIMDTNIGFLKA